MKVDLFQADFVDGEYQFTLLPFDGSIPNEYRSNNSTYTPNEIRYHDTRFFLYCNHDLNEYELRKLEKDWKNYCPE